MKKVRLTFSPEYAARELRCGDYLSLFIFPQLEGGGNLKVEDEDGTEIYNTNVQTRSIIGEYILDWEDNDWWDDDDYETIQNYYYKAEFVEPYMRCMKDAWYNLPDNWFNETKFINQIICEATGGDREVAMKLLMKDEDTLNPLVVTFELELEDYEKFDPRKLDFFIVGKVCSENDEIITEAFRSRVALLNLLRYGDKIYQNCGENDGFVEDASYVKEATVDCSSDNLDL